MIARNRLPVGYDIVTFVGYPGRPLTGDPDNRGVRLGL